jgi:integrase
VTKGRSETKLTVNPAQNLVKLAEARSRDRYLEDWELGLLFRALPEVEDYFEAPFRLLLLTGARRSEVFEAQRTEFDLKKGEWLIPAERSKNGKPLLLPLSPAALKIVAKQLGEDSSPLLFPSRRKASEAGLSGMSKARQRLEDEMKELAAEEGRTVEPWTVHDLRRTVASGMAALMDKKHCPLIQPHIIEAVLNHISGTRAGVAGTYNRHHYYAEKKAALKLWAAHLEKLEKRK